MLVALLSPVKPKKNDRSRQNGAPTIPNVSRLLFRYKQEAVTPISSIFQFTVLTDCLSRLRSLCLRKESVYCLAGISRERHFLKNSFFFQILDPPSSSPMARRVTSSSCTILLGFLIVVSKRNGRSLNLGTSSGRHFSACAHIFAMFYKQPA